MPHAKSRFDARIAQALGSARVERLPGLPARGPLDLLALRRVVQDRHATPQTGKRQPAPALPLSDADRRRLEEAVACLRSTGVEIDADTLAAALVSEGVTQLLLQVRESGPSRASAR